MLRSLDTAKNGINTIVDLNDTLAHNMANVSTTAYKQTKLVFQDIQQVAVNNITADSEYFVDGQTGSDSVGNLSLGPLTQKSVIDFKQGSIISTGNTFDLALNGDGFFKMKNQKGEEVYTRNGAFTLNTDGSIVDLEGNQLIDRQNNPVRIDLQNSKVTDIVITQDGDINVKRGQPGSETFETIGSIDLVDFENRGDLKSLGGVYFQPRDNTLNPQIAPKAKIIQGSLETSNANAVNTMIKSIDAMRSYETMVNSIRTAGETLQKAITQTGKPIQ